MDSELGNSVHAGELMDLLTDLVSGVNWIVVLQLASLALVVISGPLVIFLLAARGGDM